MSTTLRHLSADTLRECELVRKRAERPAEFTFRDSLELLRLQRAAQLREEQRAADEAAERHSEGRTFAHHNHGPHETP